MRALYPHTDGYASNPIDDVRVFYEVFGPTDAERSLVFLAPWPLAYGRIWKGQVPYFARRGFRVVAIDPRGNGRSDRPTTGYSTDHFTFDTLAVLDALGVERAALVGLSAGARWGLQLAAEHAERVTHLVLIGPAVQLSGAPRVDLAAFHAEPPDTEGWHKYNARYWQRDYADFVDFFCGQIFTEPHSTKQIEDLAGWGLETTPGMLTATIDESATPRAAEFAAAVRCPTLIVHGAEDAVIPLHNGEAVHAAIPHSRLVRLDGCGHAPMARDPVRANLVLHDFLGPAQPVEGTWRRATTRRRKRALFVSSPIGLGHAQRDVAIADALRRLVPDLEIDWLAQDPVTRVLEARGERVHPASVALAGESSHIESECGEHDLHVFQAWRRMDEILLANFQVFFDAVRDAQYDLWLADEGWDVDYYLHENPELKTAPYVWLTDFVGWLPVQPEDERLTADYNAEMIEQIGRFRHVRDRALFVGNPNDVVPDTFGPNLPIIRDWTQAHFAFPGYVQYFDPTPYAERAAVRERLGFEDGEPVVVAAVGGTAAGRSLLQRIIQSVPEARRRVPGLRVIAVAGPRIEPESLPCVEGVEVRGYVPALYEHLAACDLALVQGGLSTTMELVATGRPFLYFPLRRHFEQTFHVPHRLTNYGVSSSARVDYASATPDRLADLMVASLRQPPSYRPVETGGAERAAQLIAEVFA